MIRWTVALELAYEREGSENVGAHGRDSRASGGNVITSVQTANDNSLALVRTRTGIWYGVKVQAEINGNDISLLLLNTTSATFNGTALESILPRPTVLSLCDLPNLVEALKALRAAANRNATGPHGLSAELVTLGLVGEALELLHHFHSIMDTVRTPAEGPH